MHTLLKRRCSTPAMLAVCVLGKGGSVITHPPEEEMLWTHDAGWVVGSLIRELKS